VIKAVHLKNFKALRHAKLPLGRFTLIVGPNGSGKSTALQALKAVGNPETVDFNLIATVGLPNAATVEVRVEWGSPFEGYESTTSWFPGRNVGPALAGPGLSESTINSVRRVLESVRLYSFDAQAISRPIQVARHTEVTPDGGNLAGVLDFLHSSEPERFELLNAELTRWQPDFDRILLDTPSPGNKSLLLRTRKGGHKIQATEVSQGTLLALAILTLAYIPNPAPIVCLEEPDRGIHPRLLRDVRDAMYRLSYPKNFGESRDPVQVIATTHSPYLLDLFKDHPEEVVIADTLGQDVRFERLSDREDLDEILGDAQLGDAWYSGVLGGVPSHP